MSKSQGPLGTVQQWSSRTWIIVGSATVVLLIVIIVPAAVVTTKQNEYPDYTPLTYSLSETYSGERFFDNFDYFTDDDPTHGYVTYVDKDTAQSLNLTYASSSAAVLRVDTSDASTNSSDSDSSHGSSQKQRRASSSPGRNSVRVTSKSQYDKGLFIFDVKHTPHGCGTWPALWLSDIDNWPTNGEIDVMEAVNKADTGNQMTLHTANHCNMWHRRQMTGSALYKNCYWKVNSESGCGVKGDDPTFGEDYNGDGGGIAAVEWRSAGIRVWQFARDSVPDDISNNAPDPSSWGTALADFPKTGCNIDSHFKNQSIIVNIALCGDWAGGAYSSSGCPSNCTDYVANNPSDFEDAYWEFGYFQVYQAS